LITVRNFSFACTGKQLNEWKDIDRAAFSPDATRLILTSKFGKARICRINGSDEIPLSEHSDRIDRIVYSIDGQYILTLSRDGYAIVWEITGEPVFSIKCTRPVVSAAFADGNSQIVLAYDKGPVKAYKIDILSFAREIAPRSLTDEECIRFRIPHRDKPTIEENPPAREEKPYISYPYTLSAETLARTGTIYPANENAIAPFVFISRLGKGEEYAIMHYDPEAKEKLRTVIKSEFYSIEGLRINRGRKLCFLRTDIDKEINEIVVMDLQDPDYRTRCIFKSSDLQIYFPCWYPDGKRIFFNSYIKATYPGYSSIHWICEQKTESQNPIRILGAPQEGLSQPVVSKDGKRICFIQKRDPENSFTNEVWIGDLVREGRAVSGIRRLTEDLMSDNGCCFGSDPETLYWISQQRQGLDSIIRMDLNSLEGEVIYRTHELGSRIGSLSLSDSGWLAFDLRKDSLKTIYFIGPDGYVHSLPCLKDIYVSNPCFVD